ncbi:MAG: hypothetical protein AAFW98_18720, partial [Pseudomonadota bacterium]
PDEPEPRSCKQRRNGPVNPPAQTLVCFALGFANYAGYAMAFSLSGFMAGYQRLRRWIDGAVAALFAAAGFGLIRSALSRCRRCRSGRAGQEEFYGKPAEHRCKLPVHRPCGARRAP